MLWMWTRMELQMSLCGADISDPLNVIQHGCARDSEQPHVTQTQKKGLCVCVCVCVRASAYQYEHIAAPWAAGPPASPSL